MSEEEKVTSITLPLARVKKIIKSDKEVKSISANGTVMICKATELFIQELVKDAFKSTQAAGKKVVKYEDVANTIHTEDFYEFLRDNIKETVEVHPQTVTFVGGKRALNGLDGTLETHIKNITEKFVTERELKFGEFQFVLQTTTGTKLTEENFLSIVGEQEKPKESTEPTQENEEEKEEEKPNKMLILVGNPLLVRNLELETKVRNDTENLMNIKNLKDHLYKLGSNLQEKEYFEEFNRQGRMRELFEVLKSTTGNTQSYCLRAFNVLLQNQIAQQLIITRPEYIIHFFTLSQSSNFNVAKHAIAILANLCSVDIPVDYLPDSVFYSITADTEECEKIFKFIVKLLKESDLDTQLNCLSVIVNLARKSSDEARRGIIKYLESIFGLRAYLKNSQSLFNTNFLTQFHLYEKILLENHMEEIKRKLKEYQLQQPIFNQTRNELQRANQAVAEAMQHTEYLPISPTAPLTRYSERLPQIEFEFNNRAPASDINSQLAEFKQNKLLIEQMEEQIRNWHNEEIYLKKQNEDLAFSLKHPQQFRETTLFSAKELVQLQKQIDEAVQGFDKEKQTFLDINQAEPVKEEKVESRLAKKKKFDDSIDIMEERSRLKQLKQTYQSKSEELEALEQSLEEKQSFFNYLKLTIEIQNNEIQEIKLQKDLAEEQAKKLLKIVKYLKTTLETAKSDVILSSPTE